MQYKLKIVFILISFAATVLSLYAANQVPSGQHTVGGLDVSQLSPRMLSISPRVTDGKGQNISLVPDTLRADSLLLETTNN